MAITAFSGTKNADGTLTSGSAPSGPPTGGTLIEGGIVYDWGNGGHTTEEYYIQKATFPYTVRVVDTVVVDDILVGTYGNTTITSFSELIAGYYIVNNTILLRYVIDKFGCSYYCQIVPATGHFSDLTTQIGVAYTPKKFTGPLAHLDFINYQLSTGEYAVVHYWDDTDDTNIDSGTYTGTNINLGRWFGYVFTDETLADDDLGTTTDIPIITEIVIPGPTVVIVIEGGVIITDTVTDNGDGTTSITGDVYTDTDIPTDLLVGTITTEIVGDTDSLGNTWSSYPKVWRSRTTTNMPGNTEGHNNMWNLQGITMLELGSWRMRDLFKRPPTTNPMTRDVR